MLRHPFNRSFSNIRYYPYVEWKGMSDECEEVIEELRKQCATFKDVIGKLNRQINSKVSYNLFIHSFITRSST